ncbi:MAG: type II toxin-antitoxin system RelE/ParE family toxin [Treponema sp.]|nr:type II toxin-antitoxin system RelE/ParE family toxin [Treponema sp.]
MGYDVKLLKLAVSDLDEICRYLSRFYPGTVGRFLDAMEHCLDELSENPRMFPEYGEKKYRRAIVHEYLVFYRIFETNRSIRVYRIIYGKRNIR